ncbi:MAG: hypothetical protein E7596_03025 [Ruminococcaceae bacterium]|nr:hypothetical protein [Oscillospiraceae bacterium]
MSKVKNIAKWSLPYILILAFSLMGTYLVFYEGISYGDDYHYHFGNILDKYNTIVDGKPLSAISGNLVLGYGTGGGLFYSPIPHITVVVVALLLNVLGLTVLSAFKLVLILTVFISGVFMYRFGLHLSFGNKVASIIGGAVYVLYPYRLFDAFCRMAFAEAFSFLFIPLFFMGLYDIVHMDKDNIKITPFVEVIFGGALLYLSHNLTALVVFIVGIVYLAISLPWLFKLLKKPKYTAYCLVSVVLLIGIASIGMFSQLELMGLDYYNLSNEQAMWTSPEHLAGRTDQQATFSGFLNISWLGSIGVSSISLYTGLTMFVVGALLFFFADLILSTLPRLKYFHIPISSAIALLTISFKYRRVELYLGMAVFIIIYTFSVYTAKSNHVNEKIAIIKNPLFWLCIATIIFSVILMVDKSFWLNIAPAFLRKIQFPWRMWSLVQICISILACLLSRQFTIKPVTAALALLVGLLLASNQALIEKRLAYENKTDWVPKIDQEQTFDNTSSIGVCREYCPQVLTDDNYKSQYENSLCYKVRRDLKYSYTGKQDYRYDPVILYGSGTVVKKYAFAPVYQMEITAENEILVQLPLFYYPGYAINVTNQETNESFALDAQDTDGLVSFKLQAGRYKVETAYEGTALRKASFVITPISLAITLLGIGYEIIRTRKARKKQF